MKIRVEARPSSKETLVELTEKGGIKAYLTEPADKGKANMQLLKFLSRRLGAPVRLVSGATSRKKLIEVDGLSEDEFRSRIIVGGK